MRSGGHTLIQAGLSPLNKQLPEGLPHYTLRYDGERWVRTSNILNTSNNDKYGMVIIGFKSGPTDLTGPFYFPDSTSPLTRLLVRSITSSNSAQALHIITNTNDSIFRVRDDAWVSLSVPEISQVSAKLHVVGGGFLFEGGSDTIFPTPITGNNTPRFFWSPALRAIRAGELKNLSLSWDSQNVGAYSYVFGLDNWSGAEGSGVLSGKENQIYASSAYSVISGGTKNSVLNQSGWSFINGGSSNTIDYSQNSGLIGGYQNKIINQSGSSVILGGYNNIIDGSIDGINSLSALNENTLILGGYHNKISYLSGNSIVSGVRNSIQVESPDSVILGGGDNVISTKTKGAGIIASGSSDISDRQGYSIIAGGRENFISTDGNGLVFDEDPTHKYNSYSGIFTGFSNHIYNSIFSGIYNSNGSSIDGRNIIDGIAYSTVISAENFTSNRSHQVWAPKLGFCKKYDTSGDINTTLLDNQKSDTLWRLEWRLSNQDQFDRNWVYWENKPLLAYKETDTYLHGNIVAWIINPSGLGEWKVIDPTEIGLAGSGIVQEIVPGQGINVDNTDPYNPMVKIDSSTFTSDVNWNLDTRTFTIANGIVKNAAGAQTEYTLVNTDTIISKYIPLLIVQIDSSPITITLPSLTVSDDGLIFNIKAIGNVSFTNSVLIDLNGKTVDGNIGPVQLSYAYQSVKFMYINKSGLDEFVFVL